MCLYLCSDWHELIKKQQQQKKKTILPKFSFLVPSGGPTDYQDRLVCQIADKINVFNNSQFWL